MKEFENEKKFKNSLDDTSVTTILLTSGEFNESNDQKWHNNYVEWVYTFKSFREYNFFWHINY